MGKHILLNIPTGNNFDGKRQKKVVDIQNLPKFCVCGFSLISTH